MAQLRAGSQASPEDEAAPAAPAAVSASNSRVSTRTIGSAVTAAGVRRADDADAGDGAGAGDRGGGGGGGRRRWIGVGRDGCAEAGWCSRSGGRVDLGGGRASFGGAFGLVGRRVVGRGDEGDGGTET